MIKHALLCLALLLAAPAVAQQPNSTMDEMMARYFTETGQLRMGLGQAQGMITSLQKELEQTKAELEKAKKPAEPPK